MEVTGKAIKFKNWISYFQEVDLPIGILASYIRDDENFPDTNDYKKLLNYIKDSASDDSLIKIFKSTWKYYLEDHS